MYNGLLLVPPYRRERSGTLRGKLMDRKVVKKE